MSRRIGSLAVLSVISELSRIPDPHSTLPIEYSAVYLCPGAELRLARPVFKRRFRIQLELPAVHLQDLVERDSFGEAGVSIDLRIPCRHVEIPAMQPGTVLTFIKT